MHIQAGLLVPNYLKPERATSLLAPGVMALIAVLCASLAATAAAPHFEIIPADSPPSSQSPSTLNSPVIAWVTETDESWKAGQPMFRLSEGTEDASATGWGAVTTRALRLYIVVRDAHHSNTRTGAAIWDGDALQIGIDLRGEGAGVLPSSTPRVGPSGASITFALTDKGPLAWAHYHGRPGGEGALPQLAPRITRDEAAKTTTYDLTLPWAEFQSAPGIFPQIGLAVQVNDSQPNVVQQTRLYWGFGAGGNLRPGLFNRLLVGPPPVTENVASALATRQFCGATVRPSKSRSLFLPRRLSPHNRWLSATGKLLREAAVVAQIGDKQTGHPVSTKRLALSPKLFTPGADKDGANDTYSDSSCACDPARKTRMLCVDSLLRTSRHGCLLYR
jgi:hypothetical protein